MVAVSGLLEPGVDRLYAPGCDYSVGEKVLYQGHPATVQSVTDGFNPKQGNFKILHLSLPKAPDCSLAASVPGAPAQDHTPITDDRIQAALRGKDGVELRQAVISALNQDRGFIWFQDDQGDHCCLSDMLQPVTPDNLRKVMSLLGNPHQGDRIEPLPTEEIVKALWGQKNDGSSDYALEAFAVNVTLDKYIEFRWLGTGWVLDEEWRQFEARPHLVGPAMPNRVELPRGVNEDTEEEDEPAHGHGDREREVSSASEQDFEAWLQNRIQHVVLSLPSNHYYNNTLPLNQDMRRLFPPFDSGSQLVTISLYIGDEPVPIMACVDWEQRRIVATSQLYDALHEHKIYPGAKLVISHHGPTNEYDLRVSGVSAPQTVRVRRVFLVDGQLEYAVDEERPRYQIDRDVFVADARWEDIPALFKQAEEAGAGIFQLMYEECVKRWEAQGRKPLYVTPDQLFEAIHFGRRLTSKATIAWELWRRRAFDHQDNGSYLFHPEKGGQLVTFSPRPRPRSARASRRPSPAKVSIQTFIPSKRHQDLPNEPGDEPSVPKTDSRAVTSTLELGQELRTLDQGRIFTIEQITGHLVKIRLASSEGVRPIEIDRIELAWLDLVRSGNLSRTEIEKFSSHNSAYIAAMLAAMQGVWHSSSPITLSYSPPHPDPAVLPRPAISTKKPVVVSPRLRKYGTGKPHPQVRPSPESDIKSSGLDRAFLLGLILARGEIDRLGRTVTIKFSYGKYQNGRITGAGGTINLPEERVLPLGSVEIYERLAKFCSRQAGARIELQTISMRRQFIILSLAASAPLWQQIREWFPAGSNWHNFKFPKARVRDLPDDLVREFMRGAVSLLGFITDQTRAGPGGRHRVFITYSRQNKSVLEDIREVLENRLGVEVPAIHWHEGWDPQMRVYAEDFEKLGFAISWKQAILAASAKANRKK